MVQLLKYAEDNSLTGTIVLENNDANAQFIYQKGQLLQLEFEGKEEDEAMDIILEWETGSYKVEPNLSKPEEQIGKEFAEEEDKPKDSNEELVVAYLHEKLSDFIHFAGARITQRAINRCYHNFEAYFKIIHEIKISVLPEFVVELDIKKKWGDKHTLLLAIIMRDLAAAVERDVIGMIFWTPRSTEEKINEFLESLDFFEYYDQAMELVGR